METMVLWVVFAQTLHQIITSPFRVLLDAIRHVETGSEPNKGEFARGDGGNAIGPYQIWEPYWFDATERLDSPFGVYEDCNYTKYSEIIILLYWGRYGPNGLSSDLEDLARIHNGGPKGYEKVSTVRYWEKVQTFLVKNKD